MGDLFSVSWMEDSEAEDPQKETLRVSTLIVKFTRGGHLRPQMGVFLKYELSTGPQLATFKLRTQR